MTISSSQCDNMILDNCQLLFQLFFLHKNQVPKMQFDNQWTKCLFDRFHENKISCKILCICRKQFWLHKIQPSLFINSNLIDWDQKGKFVEKNNGHTIWQTIEPYIVSSNQYTINTNTQNKAIALFNWFCGVFNKIDMIYSMNER